MSRISDWFRNKIENRMRKKIGDELTKISEIETIIGKRIEVIKLGNIVGISITVLEPMEMDVLFPLNNIDEARNLIDSIAQKSGLALMEINEFDMREFA